MHMPKKPRKLAMDGDILAYRASSSVQKDIDWGDGLYTCHAYLKDAVAQFKELLDDILIKINSLDGQSYDYGDMAFFFSDSEGNFRKYYNPDYKSNRKNSRKPTCYRGLIDYIKANYYTADIVSHLEADDQLGIYATNPANKNPIIVSMDKDFKTVPCVYYDFNRDVYNDSTHTWVYWTAFQALLGDTTDCYRGCPTYGKVKAQKYLNVEDSPEETWGKVLKAFEEQGLPKDDAVMQATMAHILNFNDLERFTLGDIPPLYNPYQVV